MPRLPGPEQLGGVPSLRSGRTAPNVGNLDTGAGEIAKSLGKAGTAMVAVAEENRKEDDALDLTRADAHLQQGMIELHRQFETDTDHATFDQRFGEGSARIRTEAEGMIRNPSHRERWLPRADTSIMSTRDRVLQRGTALAREDRFDEVDGILGREAQAYVNAPDDESRATIRQRMAEQIELNRRSGLLTPPRARQLHDRHIYGTMEIDAERAAEQQGAYAALTELERGDTRNQIPSQGQLSERGMAYLMRDQPAGQTPQQRTAAERELRTNAAEMSEAIAKLAPEGMTQLQHDALVSYGLRRGRPAVDALAPHIQSGDWDAVAKTMIEGRDSEPVSGSTGKTLTPISVARQYLGNNEREHAGVLAEFFRRSGGQNLNPSQTAWCMAFVNAAIGGSGGRGTGTLMARDALSIGTPTRDPQEGDIVVMERQGRGSGLGHVGFFVKKNPDGTIDVLSGNAGQEGRVSVDTYPANRVLGYRTPPRAGSNVPGVDADARAGQTGQDRLSQEADMVTGRAPSSRYAELPADRRRALTTRLRNAAINETNAQNEDNLLHIERTGEPQRNPDGTSSFDRSRLILNPNQNERLRLRIQEAQGRFRALNGISSMTDEEAERHIESLRPSERAEGESFRIASRTRDLAANAVERVQTFRNTDPAAAASGATVPASGRSRTRFTASGVPYQVPDEDDIRSQPEPEVAEVLNRIRRRAPDIVTEGEGRTPDQRNMSRNSILQKITDDRLLPEERRAMIEARIAVQARWGIPEDRRRSLNRQEAAQLLDMPADSAMSDPQFDAKLRRAIERAHNEFGPAMAPQVIADAIALRQVSQTRQDSARRILRPLLEGDRLSEEQFRDYRSVARLDEQQALWSFGVPANTASRAGSLTGPDSRDMLPMSRPGIGTVTPNTEAGNPFANLAPKAPYKGDARRGAATPTPEEIDVLNRFPHLNRQFDAKFGPGAAAKYLSQPAE